MNDKLNKHQIRIPRTAISSLSWRLKLLLMSSYGQDCKLQKEHEPYYIRYSLFPSTQQLKIIFCPTDRPFWSVFVWVDEKVKGRQTKLSQTELPKFAHIQVDSKTVTSHLPRNT